MPYKRRSYRGRRRRSYKRKPQSRWSTYGKAAAQLGKDLGTAYSWIGAATGFNTERKLIDTGTVTINVSNAPSPIVLAAPPRGDDYTQRNGRSIKLTSTYMKGLVKINPASTANQFVRIVIGVCLQPNGTGTNPSAITLFGTATPAITAMYDLNFRNFYRIMYDKVVTVTPDWDTRIVKYGKKYQMHVIFNSGSSGSFTDIMTNALFMLVFSDQTANLPTFQFDVRSRYVDN